MANVECKLPYDDVETCKESRDRIPGYETMPATDALKKIAKNCKVKGFSGMTKAQLCEAIALKSAEKRGLPATVVSATFNAVKVPPKGMFVPIKPVAVNPGLNSYQQKVLNDWRALVKQYQDSGNQTAAMTYQGFINELLKNPSQVKQLIENAKNAESLVAVEEIKLNAEAQALETELLSLIPLFEEQSRQDVVEYFTGLLQLLQQTGNAELVTQQMNEFLQSMESSPMTVASPPVASVVGIKVPMAKQMGGSVVPNYQPVKIIAQGKGGYVFQGVDKQTGKTVAMKIASSQSGDDQNEWKVLSSMGWVDANCSSATGLVCVNKLQSMPYQPFIDVLWKSGKNEKTRPPLVNGNVDVLIMEDLTAHFVPIENYAGKISEERLVELGHYLYDTVTALHNCGLVHGDIHGRNVVYDDKTNQIKLIDFGSSCVVGAQSPGAGKCSNETLFERAAHDYIGIGQLLQVLSDNKRLTNETLRAFIDHCLGQGINKYGSDVGIKCKK
jgi:hypothetical protein